MKRGFLLGKFMPPHAGHVALIRAARQLVDQLTILVCWLPDDPIEGQLRLSWMEQLFQDCTVIGHGDVVPQSPEESPDFWPIWQAIVARKHPDPIDYLFAGEDYGKELAQMVGGMFVPLGGRIDSADPLGIGGISGSTVRLNPVEHWPNLPEPVRGYYARTVVLHGVESVGKSHLAMDLARRFNGQLVPEYGRFHCELYGTDCSRSELVLIGAAQQAMIESAKPWSGGIVFSDTDALMTAAWSQMMIGEVPHSLCAYPKADLYLYLKADVPFIDDGTRIYGDPDARNRFDAICAEILDRAGVRVAEIGGNWEERRAAAIEAVQRLLFDRAGKGS